MTLHVACDKGEFAVNDGRHSVYGLRVEEFLRLIEDYNSGRYNAGELFEQARERRSGTIK